MTEITTKEQLDQVIASTQDRPVFLYKHSTACPSSFRSKRRIEDFLESASGGDVPPFHLINVIESRPVSNTIAEILGVQHESPQLLLVDGGRCVWHKSHYEISAENIEKAIASHAA